MSDFRDPELEHVLGTLSGAYPDANTAYVAVTGRVRQMKRRRAFVASSAACLVLFGVGALAVRGGDSPQNVQPASESSDSSNDSVTSVSTSVGDDSTSSSDETSSSVKPVTTPGASTASASTTKDSSTSSSNTSGNSTSSGSSHVTVTVPNDQTTYPSTGGSIVVAVTDGSLSLVSDTPAAGFTTTMKHDRADRVEVEFSDGDTTWRIRIDLVDGSPVVVTTQH